MGWCHEFGVDIDERCDHQMVPNAHACRCEACGAICEGRFEGCARVWAPGPLEIKIVRPPRDSRRGQRGGVLPPSTRLATARAASNGKVDTPAVAKSEVRWPPPEPAHID